MLPQFWQSLAGHKSVSYACHYDARMQLEGKELVIGIPPRQLHDPLYLQKSRDDVCNMTIENLKNLADTCGFYMKMKPGSFLAAPPVFLLITVVLKGPSDSTHGLRWNLMPGTTELKKCVSMHLPPADPNRLLSRMPDYMHFLLQSNFGPCYFKQLIGN